ncbi:MAG TPA: GYF domain-containing protein [Pirellulales bacterium]|nr:GYF domain-containing protein [Pirellulales bacterium]
MTDDRFYIRVRGRVQGPFSSEQLKSMARGGQFSRLHEVSTEGQTWGRATDYPDLFPEVAAPVPKPAAALPAAAPAEGVFALVPAAAGPPPAEVSQWFYSQGGTEAGPVDFNQLRHLAQTGHLQTSDLVWMLGTSSWVPAHQASGLFPQSPASAPFAPVAVAAGPRAGRADEPQTPGMAVASLVLGLLAGALAVAAAALVVAGLAYMISCAIAAALTALLAVIFGHSALRKVRRAPERYAGGGLAVTGLVFGYIVVAIGAAMALLVLAFFLLALVGARSMAN